MCMNMQKEKDLPIKLPVFYREVIFSWSSCGGGSKAPQSQTEIRKQYIWGNKLIQTKGKTLFYKNWIASNIKFIDDLIDQTGNFKSGEEIFNQLEGYNRANWLMEYKTILKALPDEWKQVLKNTDMRIRIKKELKPFIFTENKHIYDLPVKAKNYYKLIMTNNKERSFIEKYWDKIFTNKYTWREIWTARIKSQKNKKIADFHFKLLHRILPSQENLYKWKLSNSEKCRFGCNEKGSYNHMFITCQHLRQFIMKLETIFQSIGYNIKLSYKLLLFGYIWGAVLLFIPHLWISIIRFLDIHNSIFGYH